MTLALDRQPAVESPSPAPKRKSAARFVKPVVFPVVGVAVMLLAWHLVIKVFDVQPYVAPSPGEVWTAMQENKDLLLQNLWPTTIEAVVGFVVGNVFAIVLAIVFVHSRTTQQALFPLAVVLKTLPIVAIAPVLVLMLGNGYTPKIIIAALITFFPTLVNVTRGLNAVDNQQLELFRILSANRVQVFTKLRVYATAPYLFSALKIAAPSAVIGAIIAEWIGSEEGLGALIVQATYNFRTPLLYATMVVASLLAILLVVVIEVAERVLVRWPSDGSDVG
jgi:NitT/TauT family transport system permease protein